MNKPNEDIYMNKQKEQEAREKIEKLANTLLEWKLKAEKANAELKKYEWALNNACAMLYAQGVESPFSDEDWHLQQAKKQLQEERK